MAGQAAVQVKQVLLEYATWQQHVSFLNLLDASQDTCYDTSFKQTLKTLARLPEQLVMPNNMRARHHTDLACRHPAQFVALSLQTFLTFPAGPSVASL